MSKYNLGFFVLVLFLLISFTSEQNISEFSSSEKFTFTSFEQQSISASLSSNIVIELEGNATTGFSWFLTNYAEVKDYLEGLTLQAIPGNSQILGTTNYYSSSSNNKIVGAGGFYSFKFNSKNIAVSGLKLKFVYMQSWEPDLSPINFNLYIDLGEGGQNYQSLKVENLNDGLGVELNSENDVNEKDNNSNRINIYGFIIGLLGIFNIFNILL